MSGTLFERRLGLRPAPAAAAAILIAIGTLFRFLIAWNRALQVDEVEHVHAAYNVSRGLVPYRDFIQGHTPLLHYLLAPLVRQEDPIWTFIAARMVMFAATILTLVFAFLLARRLFGTASGVATVILLGFNTTFAERAIEIRADPWLGLAAVFALWLELRRDSRLAHSIGAAIAAAIAVLFTQKALFLCVALGLIWIARAVQLRRLSRVLGPSAAFPIPILLSFIPFLAAGAARDYLFWGFLHPFGVFSGQRPAQYVHRFSPVDTILLEGVRNGLFDVLVMAGIIVVFVSAARSRELRFEKAALAFCSLFFLASLWLNPYPFSYTHPAVLPVVGVAAGALVALSVSGLRNSSPLASIALAGLIMIGATYRSLPRMAEKTDPGVRTYQSALLQEVQAITAPNEPVLDLAGLYFRPDSCWTYVMSVVMMERYHAGIYPRLIPQWEKSQPVAVLWSYRMAGLPERELAWLKDRFLHYRGNIYVLGRGISGRAGESQTFPVLRTRRFRWAGPPGALAIDGRPFTAGMLAKGDHVLTLYAPASGVLIMDPPGRSHPEDAPRRNYFVAFD